VCWFFVGVLCSSKRSGRAIVMSCCRIGPFNHRKGGQRFIASHVCTPHGIAESIETADQKSALPVIYDSRRSDERSGLMEAGQALSRR
jgi:hypothetical protein